MNQNKNINGSADKNLTEARIQGIILEDILFRSPFYGMVALIILGSISVFFVWFVLNVLRPYIMNY